MLPKLGNNRFDELADEETDEDEEVAACNILNTGGRLVGDDAEVKAEYKQSNEDCLTHLGNNSLWLSSHKDLCSEQEQFQLD